MTTPTSFGKRPIIKGLDLRIDDGIHKLCVTSNATSTNTRNILYFIILVCMLSLISVSNTWTEHSWVKRRAIAKSKALDNMARQPNFDKENAHRYGEYYLTRIELEALNSSLVNNYMVVRLPILGTTFDVNDLSPITGMILVFLLVILRFTVRREAGNLRIAFNAIDGRYADHSDSHLFKDTTQSVAQAQGVSEDGVLAEINRIRREHHYNFLCMNEVFNFPPSKADRSFTSSKRSLSAWVAQLVFYLPACAYLLIMLNDFLSRELGNHTDQDRTAFNFLVMVPLFAIIAYLCAKCNKQEGEISRDYELFFKRDYRV